MVGRVKVVVVCRVKDGLASYLLLFAVHFLLLRNLINLLKKYLNSMS